MSRPEGEDVSEALRAWGAGDEDALADLLRLLDADLRRMARQRLGRLNEGLRQGGRKASLASGEVVREMFMRLSRGRRDWVNRSHFFAIAAHQMRNICRDHAREILAQKRGGDLQRVSASHLLSVAAPPSMDPADLLALDAALTALTALDARQASVVEMLFFAGLTTEEVAATLGMSESTVKREWRSARAWLRAFLDGTLPP